jgi:hypothetical protein
MAIELVETAVENVTGVPEACQSVITRGAQAIWLGADMPSAVTAPGAFVRRKPLGGPRTSFL